MKNLLFFFLVVLITSVQAQNNTLNLIPQPVELKVGKGTYTVTKSTSIGYNNHESHEIAEMLVKKLNQATGFSLRSSVANKAAIQLNLNSTPDQQLGNEGYSLVSSSKGVLISANQPAGLFYGMQTLLQLLPAEIESKEALNCKWTVPAVSI